MQQNLTYSEAAESSNMVALGLTKASTMKYRKVRDYLQNKTLQELEGLKTEGKKEKEVVLSKNSKGSTLASQSRQKRREVTINKTQETEFDKDPDYAQTVELGSPNIDKQKKQVKTYQLCCFLIKMIQIGVKSDRRKVRCEDQHKRD